MVKILFINKLKLSTASVQSSTGYKITHSEAIASFHLYTTGKISKS